MRIFVVKKSTLIRAAVFLLLVIGAIVYTQVAFGDAAAEPASTETSVMPVCRVATDEKVVALTFDTAFGDTDCTAQLLSVLKDEGAPATFFVMGLWAQQYPAEVTAMAQSGAEIASHSMMHTKYVELTETEMLADASDAAELLFDMTGYDTEILRLPYGSFDDQTIMALQAQGYVPLKWSLDSKDWAGGSADQIVKTVLNSVESGDIIMFQNNVPATVEALPAIIAGLKEQGFTLVTVSNLLLSGEYYVDEDGTQRVLAD
jgi:peptidoglycan/xylan/chitin deacetylase (PgdA/CDA1 family)